VEVLMDLEIFAGGRLTSAIKKIGKGAREMLTKHTNGLWEKFGKFGKNKKPDSKFDKGKHDLNTVQLKKLDDDLANNQALKDAMDGNPDLVDSWKALSEHPKWVRNNTDLLDKVSKNPHLADKVNGYYKNSHALPKNFKPPGISDGVEYDKFGFPNFKDGQVFKPIDKLEIDMKGNYSTDFTQAKSKLLVELKKTDPNAKVLSNPLRVNYNGQISEQLTWHHMQDGKTMQLVKYSVHKGKNHTGGVSIVNNHSELVGFFPID
jgi:hypothetical protein